MSLLLLYECLFCRLCLERVEDIGYSICESCFEKIWTSTTIRKQLTIRRFLL